jgi:hypothetical protein
MNKHSTFSARGLQLVLGVLACCSTDSALAATTNASATGVVITPIAITKATDLSFGNIAAGVAVGTVTVSPNGARAFAGGAVAAGGTSTAAKFDVTGQGTATYSITVTGSATLSDGATHTMAFNTVSDVTASAITSGNVTAGALTAGAQSIFVGGVLSVGANQVAGTYTGTVTATVDYN